MPIVYIVDAVSSCLEARDLFGNIELLFDFIGSSKKRIGLYSNFQKIRYPGMPQRRLKRVSTTRWSSHSSALLTVLETFDAIIDTLDDLQSDPTTDRVCCVKANSIMDYLLSERFVSTSLLFTNIFNLTSPLSKFLQGKNADLLAAVNYVKDILMKVEDLRNDTQFTELQNKKNKFIESKKNDFSFTPLIQNKRIKRVKKMSGEVSLDEPISNPIDSFKVNTYFTVLDIIITQIKDRFNEHSSPLLKDLSLFQRRRIKEIAENNISMPIDVFEGLEAIYGKFISAKNLRLEFLQFVNIYFKFETLTKLPNKLHDDIDSILHYETDEEEEKEKENNVYLQNTINYTYNVLYLNGLKDIFPNIYEALSIALTLPVSSASPERSFSKLKLIKTRLRSTMGEERLESLMMMSCEKDITLCPDEIIKTLSSNSDVLKKLFY